MWKTACLFGLLLAAVNGFDRDVAKEAITSYRLRSQHLHIDHIEKELDKLEAEFDELSEPVDEEQVQRVKARVKKLEANPCPHEKEVSCGGDWPECVHHLLVCDGIEDCHNGRDEDAEVCNGDVVRVGSSFRGVAHWHRCVEADDHYSTITVTAVKRSPFFQTRSFVRVTVTREYEDHAVSTYTARGYFVYATRQLAFAADPGSPQRVATVCDFNLGDNDHADCKIMQEASLEECGVTRVARV